MNDTIKYYNENAKKYFDSSVNVDMHILYEEFLQYVSPCGSILDIGCGSGRDLKYFKDRGYDAEGLEVSSELKKLAEEYSKCKIYECSIQEFSPSRHYDAIWACASLLHLEEEQIYEFFNKLDQFLKPKGVIFASMKSGIQTGRDNNNRYFTNFTEDFLSTTLSRNTNIQLIKLWYSTDILNRDDFSWLNFIIRLSEE